MIRKTQSKPGVLWVGPWQLSATFAGVRSSMFSALCRQGFDVSVVMVGPIDSGWLPGECKTVCVRPVSSAYDKAGYILDVCRILRQHKGDYIIFGDQSAHFAALARVFNIVFFRKQTVIVDIRTLPVPTLDARGDKLSKRRFWEKLRLGIIFSHGWMGITERLNQAVLENLGWRAKRLPRVVWQSAVDARFLESGAVPPWEPIVKKGHKYNLLYLGSLEKGRRLELAVEAMAELRRRRSDVGLHFVGEGNGRGKLEEAIKQDHLQECVHLHPRVPYSQTLSVVKACDLGILPLPDCPAWSTSSALKLFEYMAQARCVLVSSIPAHLELLNGKPFAFLMKDYTAAAFARETERFLELSSQERSERGLAAREFVRQNHTYDHRARVIADFLRAVRA